MNQFRLSYDLKNYGLDLRGCRPPRPNKTLLDRHNSSDHALPHSIIVKYYQERKAKNSTPWTDRFFQREPAELLTLGRTGGGGGGGGSEFFARG